MNKRATEYDLNDAQFEQLMDKYIMTIVDSMSMEDFRQFVINSDVENVKQFTKMPAISDELYAELVKEFNNDSYYFFN